VIMRAEQAALLGRENREQQRTLRFFRTGCECPCQLEYPNSAGGIIVRARANVAIPGAIVIVMSAEDDRFSLQRGITAFDQAKHVVGSAASPLREDDAHLDAHAG